MVTDKEIKEMGLGELVNRLVVSHLIRLSLRNTPPTQLQDGTIVTDYISKANEEGSNIALYKAELDRREKLYRPVE